MIRQLAMTAVLGLAAAGAHAATTLDVSLDGYCNTFTLTQQGYNVWGTRQGCGYTVIDGGVVAKVNGVQRILSYDTNDQTTIYTWAFTPPDANGAGYWRLYGSDGSVQELYLEGTYSSTAPEEARALSRPGKDATTR